MLAWLRDFERRLQYTAPHLRDWLNDSVVRYRSLAFLATVVELLDATDPETALRRALDTDCEDLSTADKAVLCVLGGYLGKSDANMQLQCVREVIATLEEHRACAMKETAKADKLYLTLGTSGGLALAILLI